MFNPLDDSLAQKVILLMTGVPGTVAMRDEVSRLIKAGDPNELSAFIDKVMDIKAPGKIGDAAVQYVLDSGFSINDLTPQKIDQITADSLRQGIDSWTGLFSYAMDKVDNNVGKVLGNRAEAADVFTGIVDELDVDVNVNHPLVQEWIDKIDASDESLSEAKNTVKDLIDELTTLPVLVDSNPSDDSTAIAAGQDIVLTFNKRVTAGSGDILIVGSDGDTRTIAVTDSSQVTITGKTLKLNPTEDLHKGTDYSVQLASGVIMDRVDHAFAGISDATTLNFRTVGSTDTTPPTITSGDTAAAIDENSGEGRVIYTVTSDDATATYSLSGADAAAFGIDNVTGEVWLLADPDYESKNSYSFTVVATDHPAGNRSEQAVSLAINDVPEVDDHLINTYTTGNQAFISTTALVDGGFVVTWASEDQDGSRNGIYGQRYDVSGAAQGGEFRVNTTTLDSQENPSVTALADGGFVVTWQSGGQDGSAYGVYGQRYDVNAVAQGTEFRINTYTTLAQVVPSVTALTDGGFIVTWTSEDQDGSGSGIYGQRYDASGAAQGSEFPINTYTIDTQFFPTVVALANNGFVVMWESRGQDGSGEGVYGQRYDTSGVPQGAEFRVNTTTADDQHNFSVAAFADGGFIVTWTSHGQDGSGDGIYGQRYDASGVPQGAEFRINTTTVNGQDDPSVTVLTDGGFLVTWTSIDQDGLGEGIYGQRYNAGGVMQGTEFRVNTYTFDSQSVPTVVALADGGFVVTWTSVGQDGSDHGVYGKRYDASGAEVEWSNGSTFVLTTAIDTIIGTSGNDLFLGPIDSGVATLQSGDVIDGGGGDDIAQFELNGGSIPAPTIKSVELIDVRTGGVTGGASLDMSNIDGLKTIVVQDGDGGGDTLSFDNVNNVVHLSIGNTDSSVILNYKDFIFSSTTDGSMSLNLADMNGAVTINNSIDILKELNIWTYGDSNTLTLDGSALGSFLYIHDYFISTGVVSDLNLTILGDSRWIDARGTVGDHVLDLKNSTRDLEVFGGSGNETITNGIGSDTVTGGDGDDTIWGAISTAIDDKRDILGGGGGNDIIGGSYGDDEILGDAGNDSLFGDEGNDFVEGGDGNDIVRGDWGWGSDDVGMDSLFGGLGVDQITGGFGADTFLFFFGDSGITNDTIDVITDFVSGEDIITLFNPTGSGGFFNAGASVLTNFSDALANANDLMDAGAGNYIFASDTINGWLFINMESASGVDMVIQLSGVTSMVATDITVTIT